jgi:lipopolysaccharide transport system permease protein
MRLIRLINPFFAARTFLAACQSLRKNLPLAVILAKRELTARHAGQVLGVFWAIGQPLFLMLLYVFIFGVVFAQRIGGSYEMPRDYTTYILSGLVPWLALLPALSTTCLSLISNAPLVKQFTLDPSLFPIKDVAVTIVFWVVGIAIVTVTASWSGGGVPWTLTLLPIAFGIQFATAIGLGWFLSAISVFVRDVKEVVQLFATAGVFVLPIVYLPNWIPDLFRPFVYLNPLSYMIWIYQDVFYFGRIEHPYAWIASALIAFLSIVGGYRVFSRLQPYFSTYL